MFRNMLRRFKDENLRKKVIHRHGAIHQMKTKRTMYKHKISQSFSLVLALLMTHTVKPLSIHVHIWAFKLCSKQAHHTFQKIMLAIR
jgi:hypothetical protein